MTWGLKVRDLHVSPSILLALFPPAVYSLSLLDETFLSASPFTLFQFRDLIGKETFAPAVVVNTLRRSLIVLTWAKCPMLGHFQEAEITVTGPLLT